MFYTYVLRSRKDGDLYIGCTSDLRSRFETHQKGLVESTRSRRPFILIYYEACLSEDRAFKREKYFKTGYGRRFLKDRVEAG